MLTAAHTIAPVARAFHPRRIGAEEPVTARIRSRAEALPATLPPPEPAPEAVPAEILLAESCLGPSGGSNAARGDSSLPGKDAGRLRPHKPLSASRPSARFVCSCGRPWDDTVEFAFCLKECSPFRQSRDHTGPGTVRWCYAPPRTSRCSGTGRICRIADTRRICQMPEIINRHRSRENTGSLRRHCNQACSNDHANREAACSRFWPEQVRRVGPAL